MRTSWRNLLLMVGSLLFAGLLAEGLLRVAGYSYTQFHRPDPELGWVLRPGIEGWWRKEGEAYVRINSQGLRDREHSLAKPSGTVRIAVLGDSFTEALQVPREATFWAVAERRLNRQCPALAGRIAEVINFGVSDYGTAQELLMLRKRVWGYDPDVVVLAFLSGNDVRNNSEVLDDQPGRTRRPYFRLQDGELVLDDSFREQPNDVADPGPFQAIIDAMAPHSRLVQLAQDLRAQFAIYQYRRTRGTWNANAAAGDSIHAPPASGAWRQAWAVTEALVRQMAGEVQARGKHFLFMTLTGSAQVHPDPEVRARKRERWGVEDLSYADRRILAVAEAAGADTLMTAPVLRAWAEQHGQCVHGFDNAWPCGGHWNVHGHRVAGELLADALCDGLVTSG